VTGLIDSHLFQQGAVFLAGFCGWLLDYEPRQGFVFKERVPRREEGVEQYTPTFDHPLHLISNLTNFADVATDGAVEFDAVFFDENRWYVGTIYLSGLIKNDLIMQSALS